jgi:hypothetical protein
MPNPIVAPFTAEEINGSKKRLADDEQASSAEDPAEDDASESGEEDSGDASSDQGEDDAASSESEAADDDDDDDDDDEEIVVVEVKTAAKKGSSAGSSKAKGPAAAKGGRKAIRSKTLSEVNIARDYTLLHDHKPTPKELEQQKKLCADCSTFSDLVSKGLDLERDCRVIKNNETGAIIYVTALYTKKECERIKKTSMGWRELTPNMLNTMALVKAWAKANMAALKAGNHADLDPLFGKFSAPTTLIESHHDRATRVAPSRAAPTKADGTSGNGRKRSQPSAATDSAVTPLAAATLPDLPALEPTDIKTLARIMLDRQPATSAAADGKQFFKRMTASNIANQWPDEKLLQICNATTVIKGVMDTMAPSFSEQHQLLLSACAEGAAQPGFTMQYCMAACKEVLLEGFALAAEHIDALCNESQLLRAHVAALRLTEKANAEEIEALKKDAEDKEAGAKITISELSEENASLKLKFDKLAQDLKEATALSEKLIAESETRTLIAANAARKSEAAAAPVATKPAPTPAPGSDKVGWTSGKTGITTEIAAAPAPASKTTNGSKKSKSSKTVARPSSGGKSPRSAVPVVAQTTEPAVVEAAPKKLAPASLFE